MKKIALLSVMLLGFYSLSAQTSYSCTHREYCDWNEKAGEFDNCEGYDESSLFVVNDDMTVIKHTTESMSSSYYVSSKEYDKKNKVWVLDVTSDVGNKYTYIFDKESLQVRCLIKKDGETKLLRFTVKAVF